MNAIAILKVLQNLTFYFMCFSTGVIYKVMKDLLRLWLVQKSKKIRLVAFTVFTSSLTKQ